MGQLWWWEVESGGAGVSEGVLFPFWMPTLAFPGWGSEIAWRVCTLWHVWSLPIFQGPSRWRVALGRPSCGLEQVSWGGWMSFGTLRCGPSSERRESTQGFSFLLFPGKCRAIFELLGWDGRVQRSWEISPFLYCRLSTSGFASGDLVDWHAGAFALVDLA